MIKLPSAILLAAVLLAACGPSEGNKPAMQQQRETLEQAKRVESLQQQQAQQQRQEAERQGQ